MRHPCEPRYLSQREPGDAEEPEVVDLLRRVLLELGLLHLVDPREHRVERRHVAGLERLATGPRGDVDDLTGHVAVGDVHGVDDDPLVLEPTREATLCCGSAGTYSILQPELSVELRRRKLAALTAGRPQMIATANIGCLEHLRAVSPVPVRHWIEVVADALEVSLATVQRPDAG